MSPSARRVDPALLLVVGVVVTLGWVLVPSGGTSDLAFLGASALAAAAAWLVVPPRGSDRRPVVQLIAGGLTLGLLADVSWQLAQDGGRPSQPLVADLARLAAYLLLIGAVLVLLSRRGGRRSALDVDLVIDVLTVASVCVLVMWELVVRDLTAEGRIGSTLVATQLVPPLVGAVLVGLTVRALADRFVRRAMNAWIPAALALWLLANVLHVQESIGGRPTPEAVATYLLGSFVLAGGAARLGRSEQSCPLAGPEPGSSTVLRLLLAVAPLAVPPVLVVVETLIGRDPESWSLVVGMTALIGLAFWRFARLVAAERANREELAVARDAALAASHAKSAFLASISHEIRTPMNGVLGLSRLLAASDLDDEQRQYTDGIQRAGESLMSLLNDVLDFARFEDGKVQVASTDFDVVSMVEEVAAMVAEQAHHQGVELVVHCSPELADGLEGDPTKLRQVLLNLAANAIAFTSDGEVEISVRRRAGGPVRFAVRDTGPGIDPADQERIFQAFTQVGGARVPSRAGYGGTGLGLAISRTLVEAMGGRIGLSSSPGVGSTFWCDIPLAPARQQVVLRTRPSRARPGTRVLVVDDNARTRAVLTGQLGWWDLDVTAVADGPSALVALERAHRDGTPYQLALVDLAMPGMGGIELIEAIRAAPTAGCTPVVALSAGPDVPAARLRRSGVEVSVPKPVSCSRLQGAVQRALGTSVPLGSPADAAGLADPADEPAPLGRGVVLVAEDSEVNQMVAVGTLRQLGYLADVATNGAEAVAMVAAHHYDAVLMDCRMPVMDGFDATTEIRRTETGHRVPIIAVTADADRDRCLAVGMDDFLLKPLGRQQLSDTLARWVTARTVTR